MAASMYRPISCILGSIAVFTLALVNAPPRSNNRFAAVVLLAALTYAFQLTFLEYCQNRVFRAAAIGAAWPSFLSAFELLLVSRVDIQDLGRGGSSHVSAGQVLRAAVLPFNCRRIGTKWQVETPPFYKDGSVPGRTRFLVRELPMFLACYLFMDLCSSAPPPDPSLVSREKQSIFYLTSGQASTEDIIFRIASTLMFHASSAVGVVALYKLLAVVAVALGDQPSNWPPVWYGWPGQAYSVRRFWGKYYHQGLRRALTGPADYIVDMFLPRGTVFSRYTRLTLAFLLSAMAHHAAERPETGQLVFFSSQALAIMLEDAVQALYKSSGLRLPRAIEYALGYLWVLSWMTCIYPFWSYSTMRAMDDPVRDQSTFGIFKKLMPQPEG